MNAIINGVVARYLTIDQLIAWMPRDERFYYVCREGMTFGKLNYLIGYFPNIVLREVYIVRVSGETIEEVKWLPKSVRKIRLSGNFAKLVLPDHIVRVDCRDCVGLIDASVCGRRVDLEEIYFRGSTKTKMRYVNVECLDLCVNLRKVALSINCTNLPLLGKKVTHLHLIGCHKLCDIDSVRWCDNLRNVRIEGCDNLKDFAPLGNCLSLRKFYYDGQHADDSLMVLTKCVHLRTYFAENLDGPINLKFGGMKAMRTIGIKVWSGCDGLGLGKLRNVTVTADIFDVALLNPMMIKKLVINSGTILNLHLFGRFKRLRTIRLRNCVNCGDCGDCGGYEEINVKIISFFKCSGQVVDMIVRGFGKKVEELHVWSCINFNDSCMREIGKLGGLRKIFLWGCRELTNINDLCRLEKLEAIGCYMCPLFERVEGLKKLTSVIFYDCWNVGGMRGEIYVGQDMSKVEITLNCGIKLVTINSVVKDLKIHFAGYGEKGVLSFGEMACVKNINVRNGILRIEGMKSVESLILKDCRLECGLGGLGGLGGLDSVRHLDLVRSYGDFSYDEIVGMKLRSLTMDYPHVKKWLVSNSRLLNVNELCLIGGGGVVLDLEELFGISNLRNLYLKDFSIVRGPLHKFRDLEYLEFEDCENVGIEECVEIINMLHDNKVYIEIM